MVRKTGGTELTGGASERWTYLLLGRLPLLDKTIRRVKKAAIATRG